MELFTKVLGKVWDTEIAEKLHDLSHVGAIDEVRLAQTDLARRRIRAVTHSGRDIAVALSRDEKLTNGAVLELSAAGALVVRVDEEFWLRVDAPDLATALALGYHAGNLHWRVRFRGASLLIALEGDSEIYTERLGAAVNLSDLPMEIEDEEGNLVSSDEGPLSG